MSYYCRLQLVLFAWVTVLGETGLLAALHCLSGGGRARVFCPPSWPGNAPRLQRTVTIIQAQRPAHLFQHRLPSGLDPAVFVYLRHGLVLGRFLRAFCIAFSILLVHKAITDSGHMQLGRLQSDPWGPLPTSVACIPLFIP